MMTMMKSIAVSAMIGAVVVLGSAMPFQARAAEPSYKGDPSVYKVIFENKDFRVILGTRKAGQKDKPHGHPLPGIVYNVNDCKNKLYSPDGKTEVRDAKGGSATATPIVESHQTENIGTTDCMQVFVEKK